MAVKNERLIRIRGVIQTLSNKEKLALSVCERKLLSIRKCFFLLMHECIKDDVRVRAESLAYLMVFSVLPLIAGLFFLVSVFSQVGMVQEGIQSMMSDMLAKIPEEHRDFIAGYILKFKDQYFTTLLKKSSTLGIFSFSVLAWVGLKVYSNIDATMNHIWSSERQRPLMEKVRNFIVVSAISPIILITGISIPLIMKQWVQRVALEGALTGVITVLNGLIPSFLIFLALVAMYRYLPVEKVKWRSAFWGAVASMIALQLINVVIQFYFKFGTQTAYGKAAVLPILGLWIYFAWLMVILGGEISYLVQHGDEVIGAKEWSPSFQECEGIINILTEAHRVYVAGEGPLSFTSIQSVSRLDAIHVRQVLQQLIKQKLLIECVLSTDPEGQYFSVVKELSKMTVDEVLRGFFVESSSFDHEKSISLWRQSLEVWLEFFKDKRLENL
jgi:membrane protein